MSKASIAQEPSMDEILASIRRIIETGEDRGGVAPVRNAGEPGAPAPRITAASARLPERFDARDLPGVARASNPVLAAAASDVSLRVSASLPVAGATLAELDDEAKLTADLEQELAASWGQPDVATPAAAEPDVSLPESTSPTEGSTPMSDHPMAPAARAEPESEATDRSAFSPANSDRPLSVADDPYDAVTLPLTSEATSTLVATSFNDLAQAIRSGELRSIEAMAQEMLRPMLQEWLDDNLPRMVERLVREEIERMSRGGRR